MRGAREGRRARADSLLLRMGLAVCLGATGCATMRELPRAQYAARDERKGVVVDTREGLHYRFDYARFSPDTLVGYRLRDNEGAFQELDTLAIPLEAIERLSVRRTNWVRTGLIGGGVIAAATAVAVGRKDASPPSDTGPVIPPVEP
jgi:hypothetical protein